MKNLSAREKRDLDYCVFRNLGEKNESLFKKILNFLFFDLWIKFLNKA